MSCLVAASGLPHHQHGSTGVSIIPHHYQFCDALRQRQHFLLALLSVLDPSRSNVAYRNSQTFTFSRLLFNSLRYLYMHICMFIYYLYIYNYYILNTYVYMYKYSQHEKPIGWGQQWGRQCVTHCAILSRTLSPEQDSDPPMAGSSVQICASLGSQEC